MPLGVCVELRDQANSGDFPHLLIYGPSGAGKKTRIVATLKELYGPAAEKVGWLAVPPPRRPPTPLTGPCLQIRIDSRVFQTTSNRKIEFSIVSSNYHLEITPSDVGSYDRVVIQSLLKETAQTQQVDTAARHRFKVVVINEAEHLTRDAQAALRRTMEKYSPNLRLILVATSTANIMAPIRSRTLLVRVAAPAAADIVAILRHTAALEDLPFREPLAQRIAADSGRNLRRALLMFEAVHAQKSAPLHPCTPLHRRTADIGAAKWSRTTRPSLRQTTRLSSPRLPTKSSPSTRPPGPPPLPSPQSPRSLPT